MSENKVYHPYYGSSWALVIGINSYPSHPLEYARHDAEVFAKTLVDKFHFPQENVKTLFDEDATSDAIKAAFLDFAGDGKTLSDDRIVVFYAGHGVTKNGHRGDVGYLVPVDGSPEDLTSLIRWSELTSNAELITAKHILFVMDACYGGLAITRYIPPGSKRFLKDMLQRFSRQVITAGKADQPVADGGGPRPNHSIFTGHLLDALDGKAAASDGILTANNVMAYVYNKVGRDGNSHQTPHFGSLEGDGDFIFNFESKSDSDTAAKEGQDTLISIPASFLSQSDTEMPTTSPDLVKEYLTDNRFRIKLDDIVNAEIRKVLELTDQEAFPLTGASQINGDVFGERLRSYEAVTSDIQKIALLIGKWGGAEHRGILHKILARMADQNDVASGLTWWIALRWYPLLIVTYAAGISALSVGNYDNLFALLCGSLPSPEYRNKQQPAITAIVEGVLRAVDGFKRLPGYERNYVPHNEYIFKYAQPLLEDELFLGKAYESVFDKFEIFVALVVADYRHSEGGGVWGPPGRFAWKYNSWRGAGSDPFSMLMVEAEKQKDNWPPIKAGFFQGSYDHFKQLAEAYEGSILKKTGWM